jgi:adenylate cyclase
MNDMASLIPGFEYDIFISYRQKDNKHDGWVTEFVNNLAGELESTFKEEISIYFDINPHDGLLDTYDVGDSLKDKLKCLVFIPVISRTYCDPKCFAFEHEFKAFVEQASLDKFGLKVKLAHGNVACRVLPVHIHELESEDTELCTSILGNILRGVEFIYKEPGVNRPLKPDDDEKVNLDRTKYRNQINKVANAVREIITAMSHPDQKLNESQKGISGTKYIFLKRKSKLLIIAIMAPALIALGILLFSQIFPRGKHIEKSIAVLPFINDSQSDSTTYFINGVMEEILNNLQTIENLRVIGRNSVEQYREKKIPTSEIARKLNVNYILEGSGQKYGNIFRLRVQLIKADDERYLWARPYEKEIKDAKDIFGIQSEIAQSIAKELEAAITPREERLIRKTPTTDLRAYDAYLKGMFHLRLDSPSEIDLAMKYFEQAVDKDPNFAPAYAGISNVWRRREQASITSPNVASPKALAFLMKALSLDSTSAEVYYSLANVKTYIQWDWAGGESAIRKAISLNPNNAEAYIRYTGILVISGRIDEALEKIEMAMKLDPEISSPSYALALFFARRYDEAIDIFQEVLKKDSTNMFVLGNLPLAFHVEGRYKEELDTWKSYLNIVFKKFVHVFDYVKENKDYADILSMEADTLVAQSKRIYINPTEIALIYACAGNKERTLQMLEQAYEVHDPAVMYLLYPVYDNLRNEPRFREIARKLNVPYK